MVDIELTANEERLRAEIQERVDKVREALASPRINDSVRALIGEAGERAHTLHMSLKQREREPKHHAYMIENRGVPPENPKFYMHLHPIEDLLQFLKDEHANDDPTDQTLGERFEFRVFSNRWGRDEIYNVVRTEDGWTISHNSISGPCDKGGRPFLFEKFSQDLINYPSGLDGHMEWLWNRAATDGLTREQVQDALQQLADWVSKTEELAPSGGTWEGY